MFSNYLKIAWRNILKSKIIAFINIFGLAISLAASLFIFQYFYQESNYDDFHKLKDRIFRLQEDRYKEGRIIGQWAGVLGAAGPFIKANLPEVERYVQLLRADWGNLPVTISYNDISFREPHAFYSSSDFFKIFSFRLIQGIDSLVLKRPHTIVISESVAAKYFGKEDPIGKTLRMDKAEDYEVTGVFEDIPLNSHMNAEVLISLETLLSENKDFNMLNWKDEGYHTYLLMAPHTNLEEFQLKMRDLVWEEDKATLIQYNERVVFNLQKLTDIHLDSHYIQEYKSNGDRKTIYFLFLIAIFILVIGWINYINLYTSKSLERAKEVGVRKAMGSLRQQLVVQILIESALLNLVGVVLALSLLALFAYNPSLLPGMGMGTTLFQSLPFWILFIVILVISIVVSGIYPAFVLSGYPSALVLKGKFTRSAQGMWLRKSLLVFQFVATLTLLTGTLTVYRQITFMHQQELGMSIDQTLVVRAPNVRDTLYNVWEPAFKNKLLMQSSVRSMASTSDIPGQPPTITTGSARRLDQDDKEVGYYYVNFIDEDYLKTLNLKFIAGHDYLQNANQPWNDIIINETAFRKLGFASPEIAASEKITFWRDTFRIIGVVKDFHLESFKKEVKPIIFRYAPLYRGYFTIQLNQSNAKDAITKIEETWKEFFEGYPFEYFFLDQHFNRQYEADQRFETIIQLFSTLAIIIACLGLFGLSTLAVTYRVKEIGIRKVLGASVANIAILLNKDFLRLLVIAIAISVPLGIWVMSQWLNSFAYRIDLTWWLFVIPGVFIMLITILTVLAKSLQAAMANPVNSLRND